jgi:hypothetical protein
MDRLDANLHCHHEWLSASPQMKGSFMKDLNPIARVICSFICGTGFALLLGYAVTHPPSSYNKHVAKDDLIGEWDVWVENRGYLYMLHWTYNKTPDQFKNMRHLVLGHPGNFHALYSDSSLDQKEVNETWLSRPNGRWRVDEDGKIYLDFGNIGMEKSDGVLGGLVTGNPVDGPIVGRPVNKEEDWSYSIDAGQGIYLRLFRYDQHSSFWRKCEQFNEQGYKKKEEKPKEKKKLADGSLTPKSYSVFARNRVSTRISGYGKKGCSWCTMDTPIYYVPPIACTPPSILGVPFQVAPVQVPVPVVVPVTVYSSYVPPSVSFANHRSAHSYKKGIR